MEHACVENKLPSDFKIIKQLGKGSNNKVFSVLWEGERRAFRVPRRGGDTQQQGSSKWELAHTQMASSIKAAPKLHTAWFSRHFDNGWPSGLYMVMEYFPFDLDMLFQHPIHRSAMIGDTHRIGDGIVKALQALSMNNMFVYDLKPSNIVVRFEEDKSTTVRIIDFGKEFCEWKGSDAVSQPDSTTPTIDMINRVLDITTEPSCETRHILLAVMLFQLSAITTHQLFSDRHRNKLNAKVREMTNPVLPFTRDFFKSLQGRHIAVVRTVLRSDPIKGVLKHYQGRHNAGTRRTFLQAIGSTEDNNKITSTN